MKTIKQLWEKEAKTFRKMLMIDDQKLLQLLQIAFYGGASSILFEMMLTIPGCQKNDDLRQLMDEFDDYWDELSQQLLEKDTKDPKQDENDTPVMARE